MTHINHNEYNHSCGGHIIYGEFCGEEYKACTRCGAFVYACDDEDYEVPTGTDMEANRQAWDAGETRSGS